MSFACLDGLGNGGWRGALRVAQRQTPLQCEGLGEGGRGLPTAAGMGAFGVGVRAPGGERGAGMMQGREQRIIQEFVAQTAVEAFDEGILGRLAGSDLGPVKLAIIDELQDRVRGELGPIVIDEQGRPLSDTAHAIARARTGWGGVALATDRIALRPGMALTLNGIAQGYFADRVADLLAAEGLTDSLIDTGELVAVGGHPAGGPWPVSLPQGGRIGLTGRALATSAPLGMTFGNDGRTSHILDPRTGRPAPPHWQAVSISAPSAALADALSTTACLMTGTAQVAALCEAFAGVRLETAIALRPGSPGWSVRKHTAAGSAFLCPDRQEGTDRAVQAAFCDSRALV